MISITSIATTVSAYAHAATQVHLKAQTGYFVSAVNGGATGLTVDRPVASTWETLIFTDRTNGSNGTFSNGDEVVIQAESGDYITADCGGGSTGVGADGVCGSVWANQATPGILGQFTLVKLGGSPGVQIANGDDVALRTLAGYYCSADVNGGGPGSVLTCNRTSASTWETFSFFNAGPAQNSICYIWVSANSANFPANGWFQDSDVQANEQRGTCEQRAYAYQSVGNASFAASSFYDLIGINTYTSYSPPPPAPVCTAPASVTNFLSRATSQLTGMKNEMLKGEGYGYASNNYPTVYADTVHCLDEISMQANYAESNGWDCMDSGGAVFLAKKCGQMIGYDIDQAIVFHDWPQCQAPEPGFPAEPQRPYFCGTYPGATVWWPDIVTNPTASVNALPPTFIGYANYPSGQIIDVDPGIIHNLSGDWEIPGFIMPNVAEVDY